jgi:hypothetical protein
VRDHYEPLEAALQSEYGIDLRRALWGPRPLGVRRLWSLVRHLPPGNALDRALDPDGYGAGWGTSQELQAQLVEIVHALYCAFVQANFKLTGPPPKPVHIPRPGEQRRRMATPEELHAWLMGPGRMN